MEQLVKYRNQQEIQGQDLQGLFSKNANSNYFPEQDKFYSWDELLKKLGVDGGKKSFLVFKNNKYITIQTDQIAFFYIRNETVTITTFQGVEYAINQSLDQVQGQLSSKTFFRLNRQYLINFNAIKEVEHYFARKLFVALVIPSPDKLLINKEKTSIFLNWLECR